MQRTARIYFIIALLFVWLVGVFDALAENGRLLSRTELVIPADALGQPRIVPQFSNAVQRARFWKFTYESDGLKVCGYMAGPRTVGPHPCIIDNRGGNRAFAAWTETNSVRWLAPICLPKLHLHSL